MSQDTAKAMGRRHLLKGAAALGVLAALQAPGLLDAADSDAAGPSPVGAWMLQLDSGGDKSMDLFAFTKDGLVIDAGSVPLKAPPASENGPITIGLGTWAHAADGGVDVTFASLGAGANGALAGTVTISAHAVLGPDGNTFHGSYKITGRAGGKVVYTGSGTVKATRIMAGM